MSIPTVPDDANILRDFAKYRAALTSADAPFRNHVIEHVDAELGKVRGPDGRPRYSNPSAIAAARDKFQGYADFALGGEGSRNGNAFGPGPDDDTDPPIPGTTVQPKVSVNAAGAVVHLDSNGKEIPEAHEYMHEIFNTILKHVRNKLEAINLALQAYAVTPTPLLRDAYTAAVTDYQQYTASLVPGGSSPYATAFNSVKVTPLRTEEGFIVSVKVELNWKNPFHSSSRIKVP